MICVPVWARAVCWSSDRRSGGEDGEIFHRQVAPRAIGAETSDIGGLITRIEERVVELLGSQPGRLRAYASSMRRDITPREEAERLGRRGCGQVGGRQRRLLSGPGNPGRPALEA